MTTWRPVWRRPAILRYAVALALLAFAAYVGENTSCDDRIPGIILLPAWALQVITGLASFVAAGWAAWRRERRTAILELRDGVVVVMSIPVSAIVFTWLLARHCECCA